MAEIAVWVIAAIGLLIFLVNRQEAKDNQKELTRLESRSGSAPVWDSVHSYAPKRKDELERKIERCVIWMYIGGFLALFPILRLLGKWGIL